MNKAIFIGELALNISLCADGHAETGVGDWAVNAAMIDGRMELPAIWSERPRPGQSATISSGLSLTRVSTQGRLTASRRGSVRCVSLLMATSAP